MQRAALNQNQTQLDDAEAVLNEQDAALTAQEAQLTETGEQLDEAETGLSQMRTLLDVGQNDYTDGIAQLEYQRKTQTAKLDEAYASLITFQNGIKEYNEGLASYNDGVKELADGKAEYEDGLKDYEDGKKDMDTQLRYIGSASASVKRRKMSLGVSIKLCHRHGGERSVYTAAYFFQGSAQAVQRLLRGVGSCLCRQGNLKAACIGFWQKHLPPYGDLIGQQALQPLAFRYLCRIQAGAQVDHGFVFAVVVLFPRLQFLAVAQLAAHPQQGSQLAVPNAVEPGHKGPPVQIRQGAHFAPGGFVDVGGNQRGVLFPVQQRRGRGAGQRLARSCRSRRAPGWPGR